MDGCARFTLAVDEQAMGALAPDEEAALLAHCEGCAACRTRLEATERLLGDVGLGPLTAAEHGAVAGLPRAVGEAAAVQAVRRRWRRATGSALAVAAAVALVVLAPWRGARRSPASSNTSPAQLGSTAATPRGSSTTVDEPEALIFPEEGPLVGAEADAPEPVFSEEERNSAVSDTVAFEDVNADVDLESR